MNECESRNKGRRNRNGKVGERRMERSQIREKREERTEREGERKINRNG